LQIASSLLNVFRRILLDLIWTRFHVCGRFRLCSLRWNADRVKQGRTTVLTRQVRR